MYETEAIIIPQNAQISVQVYELYLLDIIILSF